LILAIDVGNTNTCMGIFDGDKLVSNWRIVTVADRTADEVGLLMLQFFSFAGISRQDICDVIISSVVPPVMYSLNLAAEKYLGKVPITVSEKTVTGINNLYDNPREVGADRIVNAVAALKLYGGPVIIVDFGTATTFCAVTEKGDYLGGIICAGIKISMDALFAKAAKLPRVDIAVPENVIGKNTVESMQAGAVFGFAGQVDYIVKKMKKELGGNAKVIATGGLAHMIAKETKSIDVINEMLTLQGLKFIYDMNKE
jgi:type III pantothenate kinase